jgi:DNA (cytosine-5)-methyltransferase 1
MKNGYNGQDAHSNLLQVVNNARPVGTAVLGSEIVANLAASDFKWPQNQQVEENKFIVEAFTKGKRPQTADDDETWDENRPAPTINAFDQGDTPATTVIVEEPVLLTMREGKPGGGKGPLLSTDKSLSLRTGNEQTLFAPIEDPILFENSYRDAARIATEGVTNTLSAKMGTGGNNTPMVAFPIQDGREIEKNQNGIGVADDGTPAYTLDQTGAQAVAYGLQGNMIGRQDHNGPQGAGISHPDDPMFSLTSTDRHGVVQYDGYNQRLYEDDVSVTLRIGRDSSDFIAQPVDAAGFKPGASADARTIGYEEGVSPSLEAGGGGNNKPAVMTPTMAVRRLTPLECERLMGWPDDWTAGQSDTHRYKQCGNGVASPVAQWIGQQLMELNK